MAGAADLANGKKMYLDKCARAMAIAEKERAPKAETLEKKPADDKEKKMGEFIGIQLKKSRSKASIRRRPTR